MLPLLIAIIQAAATLQGTVRAEGSREPIAWATVEVVGTERRVAADVRGLFTMTGIPAGTHRIRVTAPGYRPGEVDATVPAAGTLRLDLELQPQPIEIAGIEVETEAVERAAGAVGPPPARLDSAIVRLIPGLAEADVLRALQVLPSVQQASDYSSALYIRGGSPDQTLITLDGAPLFNPYHLGGIFAAIDPDATAALDVWPGAAPAAVGDRLSGAVHIWTREGGRDRLRTRGSVGLVSSRASLDGPIRGGRGSFLLSARRTYLDLFTQAMKAIGLIDRGLPYHFADAHLKVVHDLGTLGRVSGSLYYDEEQLKNRDPLDLGDPRFDDDFDWGSRAAALDWRQPLGGRFLLEARAAFSAFRSGIDFFEQEDFGGPIGEPVGEPVQTMRGRAYMRDALAAATLTTYLRSHELSAGLQLDAYRLEYDVDTADDDFFADILPEFERSDRLTTLAAFVEDEWEALPSLRLRGGARVLAADGDAALLPRFGLAWAASDRLTLTLGGGRYAQALHSFRNEESILASFLAYDLLAPGDSAGFAMSEDIVLGGEWRDAATRVRVDVYARRFRDVPVPPLPADPLEARL
ncbi:MAG TPA: TonB-dependent receptor, partial [Planctomycetota bacterium]|nr:TonB-dependent receptor [Planctomycetota bacterium]